MTRLTGMTLLLGLLTVGLSACATLPTRTHTGAVHDVVIKDDGIHPRDLDVVAGDEVRWLNRRRSPVWIHFLQDAVDELSCARGFHAFWGIEESAKIEPGQSVSLCFAEVESIGYRVQPEETVMAGANVEGGAEAIPLALHAAIVVKPPMHRRQ
jgi:plastocyanin